MLSILDEKEKAVVETLIMRFHAKEALDYLKNQGMEMGQATYYRYRKKVEAKKLERMQFIAQHFQELHLEKIDRLELIDKLMWQQFEKEKEPYRKVKILESIANAQSTISSYYESSTIALQISAKFRGERIGLDNNGDGKKIDKKQPVPIIGDDPRKSIITEDDLLGRDVAPWDMNTWVRCEVCNRHFKDTVIQYHQGKCNNRDGAKRISL
jgi:hypothetical protein